MTSLCPLFRSECKENNCVMWSNGECTIVNFISYFSREFHQTDSTEESDIGDSYPIGFERPKPTIPEEIEKASAEKLAKEYIKFMESEFPEIELTPYGLNFDLFLQTKNLTERWNLPPNIQFKIQKAEIIARQIIDRKIEAEHRTRLEQEKKELQSLIDNCVNWARKLNLKKVTHADIDAFVLENELDILPETKRSLYSMTNLKLKKIKIV